MKWAENGQYNIGIVFLMKKFDSLVTIVWNSIPIQSTLPSRVHCLDQKVFPLYMLFGGQWPLDFAFYCDGLRGQILAFMQILIGGNQWPLDLWP